ncbi:putative casein kinase I [Trypanosoma cruzi]|uniref:non-specific serine/threonine protein kinase n=1 Tax=Trypanosoma cruzi TaxID=5693 RepID=A0A2V2UHQ0_TRYCR|nr:putative casein kinase I [Trypanosoma cruzi]
MSSVKITLFQGKFRLDRLLGKGGFGEVYAGVQVSTGEPVAVKLERNKGRCFLFHEARVMQDIQNSMPGRTTPGIPELKYFGQEGDFRILIMSLLGPSLEDLHAKLGRFSLKTTVMLADEMLSRLEFIHSVGYIHRDLKPDNYLLGVGRNVRHLYLIDLGLSVRYRSTNGEHREMATGKSFVGTSRYASLRTHKGFSQSRRDDMEQLSYILIYLYRGHLPWSGLRMKDREAKEKAIGEIKQKTDDRTNMFQVPLAV